MLSLTVSGTTSSTDDENLQGGGVYGDERSRSPSNSHNHRNDAGSTVPTPHDSGDEAGTARNQVSQAVNTLLMAAYAMTVLGSGSRSSPSSPSTEKRPSVGVADTPKSNAPPPLPVVLVTKSEPQTDEDI